MSGQCALTCLWFFGTSLHMYTVPVGRVSPVLNSLLNYPAEGRPCKALLSQTAGQAARALSYRINTNECGEWSEECMTYKLLAVQNIDIRGTKPNIRKLPRCKQIVEFSHNPPQRLVIAGLRVLVCNPLFLTCYIYRSLPTSRRQLEGPMVLPKHRV